MTSFIERYGLAEPIKVLPRNAMPIALKNFLWQACYVEIKWEFHESFRNYGYQIRQCLFAVTLYVFKEPTDILYKDSFYSNEDLLRKKFFGLEWHGIYDFAEQVFKNVRNDQTRTFLQSRINHFLEIEKCAFRMNDGQFVPFIDQCEIDEINNTIKISDIFLGAREHVQRSLKSFTQKPEPDYINTIKEAISAVESAARVIVGDDKATLGQALKRISEDRDMHPALLGGFEKIYGYTSDEGGIRHAMLEKSKIDEVDARVMLVMCSAFVNYIAARHTSM
jgi:hypothetical protein